MLPLELRSSLWQTNIDCIMLPLEHVASGKQIQIRWLARKNNTFATTNPRQDDASGKQITTNLKRYHVSAKQIMIQVANKYNSL